jgi:hypothetical protein
MGLCTLKRAPSFFIRFVPENFEKIFKKHSHAKEDALSWLEIRELLIANRDILDPISWYVVLIAHIYIYTHDRSLPTNEETC